VSFTAGERTLAVAYRIRRDGSIEVRVDDRAHEAAVLGWDADHVALLLDGIRRTCRIASRDDGHWVHSPLGSTELREVPRFPPPDVEEVHGGCRAPMPGRVLSVATAVGERVTRGQVLVVLEAMKMEHEVRAPEDGVVAAVNVEPGRQVDTGDVLVVLDERREEVPA
jgi:propionyl-CoA carboxylase alpha chain